MMKSVVMIVYGLESKHVRLKTLAKISTGNLHRKQVVYFFLKLISFIYCQILITVASQDS